MYMFINEVFFKCKIFYVCTEIYTNISLYNDMLGDNIVAILSPCIGL